MPGHKVRNLRSRNARCIRSGAAPSQQLGEHAFAVDQRHRSNVEAVEPQQVERIVEHPIDPPFGKVILQPAASNHAGRVPTPASGRSRLAAKSIALLRDWLNRNGQ
jgi:hypothetical protein